MTLLHARDEHLMLDESGCYVLLASAETTLRRARSQARRVHNVGQPAVAKLERRTDMYVSNLRRYVEALGGLLEITARFPEGSVTITNFAELASGPEPAGGVS